MMIELFLSLVLAHLVADFMLQNGPERWRAGGDDQWHCKQYAIEYLEESLTFKSSRGCHRL